MGAFFVFLVRSGGGVCLEDRDVLLFLPFFFLVLF